MDPIEKLLSELAPARATNKLDQAMVRLFDRADRRARMKYVMRAAIACVVLLATGVGIGYHLGSEPAVPVSEKLSPQVVRSESDSYQPIIKVGSPIFAEPVQRQPTRTGSVAITVLNPSRT